MADFYSCFISYSSKDQRFVDHLRSELQANGIRHWFAPEDLKAGDVFRDRIEDAISRHDKFLLVLSENSITSDWVREEVETCLERERDENQLVLFPIQIDDAVALTRQAWAKSIRRQRHINDFRDWNNAASFRLSCDRLVKHLRVELMADHKDVSMKHHDAVLTVNDVQILLQQGAVPLSPICQELLRLTWYRTFTEATEGLARLGHAWHRQVTPPEEPYAWSWSRSTIAKFISHLSSWSLAAPGNADLLGSAAIEAYSALIPWMPDDGESLKQVIDQTKDLLLQPEFRKEAVRTILVPMLDTYPSSKELFDLYTGIFLSARRVSAPEEEETILAALFNIPMLSDLGSFRLGSLIGHGFGCVKLSWGTFGRAFCITTIRVVRAGLLNRDDLAKIGNLIAKHAEERYFDPLAGATPSDVHEPLTRVLAAIHEAERDSTG